MKNLQDILNKFDCKSMQEEIDRKTMLDFISKNQDNYLFRDNNVAHFTSSAFIINKQRDKVLMAYHNIMDSWAFLGGHNDGEDDCLKVAIKEAKEETGLKRFHKIYDNPISIDVIQVKNHIKKGVYVGDHLHLNITYIFVADETDDIYIKEDENNDIKWFDINHVLHDVQDVRMISLYEKIINKLKENNL